jgi:hypothetical protein
MKKIMIGCLALLLFGAATAKAQDTVETTIGTDFVSSYVWRGLELGGVSMQPTLGVSYKGLSLSAWGSVGMSNPADTKELDLMLAYSLGGFNVGVTDYWFNAGLDPLNRYFKYAADETNHVFEANIGYDFGFASLQWYTNFAGNDLVEATGKLAYSSYFEINVPFTLGDVDWTATAGAVPFATDFYGTEGFAVTNLALTASKEFQVTDTFSIPAFAQVAANPSARTAFLVFGISLQL